jgi:calcineurin-like phosphoesterase family protein
MIWFTSDLHLGHANIIKYCNRPFAHADEMDKTIIDNVFSRLHNGDVLYILGDISFIAETTKSFYMSLMQAGITPILVKGNHDRFPKEFGIVPTMLDIGIEGQKITLSHYAMRTWNCSCHGAWQLYGHSHGKLPPFGKQWDVGVDNNNFYPLSFSEVKEIMKTRENSEDFLTKEN